MMRFGIVGLGKMGQGLAQHALEQGLAVVAYNRSREKVERIARKGAAPAYSLAELVEKLPQRPRIVWLMVTAGKPVETVLFGGENSSDSSLPRSRGLIDLLEAGDIVIDAANSHYQHSIRRGRLLLKKGIKFLDVGTSGGVEGASKGACLMVGGEREVFLRCEPIFKALAAEGGYAYLGKSGSGHFVKMVHNGIEYAMMQALGEGMNILKQSEFELDLTEVARVWGRGSIIEGRLVGWLYQALRKDPGLRNSPAQVGSLGTGRWTVEEALRLGVAATAIAGAVFARYQSRDLEPLAYKVIQALRAQFGGHTPDERGG